MSERVRLLRFVNLVARRNESSTGALRTIQEVLADLLLALGTDDLAHGFEAFMLDPVHLLNKDRCALLAHLLDINFHLLTLRLCDRVL